MYPYISTGPQFKKYSPGGHERLPTRNMHSKFQTDRTFPGGVTAQVPPFYTRVALENRVQTAFWGVIPEGPRRPRGHIRDRGDRGYHPTKRATLWDLGGAREPPSNACSGVIPGGYQDQRTIFGTGSTWAITPKRDQDSGTFTSNVPHVTPC